MRAGMRAGDRAYSDGSGMREGSPTVQEGSPTVEEGSPTVQESSPTVQESSPTVREGSIPGRESQRGDAEDDSSDELEGEAGGGEHVAHVVARCTTCSRSVAWSVVVEVLGEDEADGHDEEQHPDDADDERGDVSPLLVLAELEGDEDQEDNRQEEGQGPI